MAVQVLVGGVGRTGTTILADVLGKHPELRRIPIESRFMVDADGLCDAFTGAVSPRVFADRMVEHWWAWGQGRPSGTREGGLLNACTEDRFTESLRDYLATVHDDKVLASGQLVRGILGEDSWVEDTPRNASRMNTLARFLPEARIIHITRDGRDAADSVLPLHWGPSEIHAGLDWWGAEMRRIAFAEGHIAASRHIRIGLAEFCYDPSGTVERLLGWLGLAVTPEFVMSAQTYVSAEAAHIGRWREGRSRGEQAEITAHYERILDRLAMR